MQLKGKLSSIAQQVKSTFYKKKPISTMSSDESIHKGLLSISYLDKYDIQHGDRSHPFFPLLNSLITRCRMKMNFLERKQLDHTTFCNLGILNYIKLMFTHILDEVITYHVIVKQDYSKDKLMYDRHKNLLAKFTETADSTYYNNDIMRLFCSLFVGVFRQHLKEIDAILQDKTQPPYIKAVTTSENLIDLYRLSIVVLNNLQVTCTMLSTNPDVKQCPPHENCLSNAGNFVLIPISREHFVDPSLLIRLTKELQKFNKDNVMVIIDFFKVYDKSKEGKKHFMIPVNPITIRFIELIRSFKVYYITHHDHVGFGNIYVNKDAFIENNVEMNLALEYWKSNKERYPVTKFKQATDILDEARRCLLSHAN